MKKNDLPYRFISRDILLNSLKPPVSAQHNRKSMIRVFIGWVDKDVIIMDTFLVVFDLNEIDSSQIMTSSFAAIFLLKATENQRSRQ